MMQASRARANPVRFGAFEVDVEAGELRKNGLKVPLQEQPFRVLTLLIENPGKVVTREELQQKLWPADTFVEFDRGLNTAINKVREALGDSATSPRFVETVPRRGYRFLAQVVGVGMDSSPGPLRVRTNWMTALAALLIGIIAGGLLWRAFSRPNKSTDLPLRKFSITPQGVGMSRPRAWDFQVNLDQVISPNGRYIVYVGTDSNPENRSLWLYELETGQFRNLVGTTGAELPFWSPDSAFITFLINGTIKKVPVAGGPPTAVTPVPLSGSIIGGTWNPDGTEIVLTDLERLYVVPSTGGPPKLFWQPTNRNGAFYPKFVPTKQGRAIVIVQYHPGSGPAEVELLDSNRQLHPVLPPDATAQFAYQWLFWSETGHLVYQRQLTESWSDLWAVGFSTNTMSADGTPFLIAENADHPSVSRDGTLVYRSIAAPKARHLAWVDRAGKQVGEIGESQLDMYLPVVSPDGRYVAVEGVDSTTGADIWIHDTLRPVKTRLTLDPARDSRPFWSPDGKQILFWSLRSGKTTPFIQNVDGTGTAQAVAPGIEDYPTDWSTDGEYLLLDADGYLQRDGKGGWQKVHGSIACGAQKISPNGRFVAFVSSNSGRSEVNVQPFPDGAGRWHVSPGGGGQPRWSRDGNELFYVNGDTLFSVPVSTQGDFRFGSPKRLFSDAALDWGYYHPTYDVSPDGHRFVLIKPVGPVPQPAIWVVQNWFAEFRDRKASR